MVLHGQYLERPALIRCGALTLEGLFHRGPRRPALLCCPQVEGVGMDAPALAELAWACARAGHPSLRFQHRGCGASEGARDPAGALEDAEAALEHLGASAPGPLAVAGLGSGCQTAVRLLRAHPHVGHGVLVAPTLVSDVTGLAARVLVLAPELAPAAGPGKVRGARVEVIHGADALFRAGLPALGKAATAFLEEA